MTHLQTALSAILAKYGMTARAAAESLEIHPANMSRTLSGDQVPSRDTAKAIITRIAKTDADRETIAWTYLNDEAERIDSRTRVIIAPASAHGMAIDAETLKRHLAASITALAALAENLSGAALLAQSSADRARDIAAVADPYGNTLEYPKNKSDPSGLVAEDPPTPPKHPKK